MDRNILAVILWAAGILIASCFSLIGAIYWSDRKRADQLAERITDEVRRLDRRLDEYHARDALVHERLRGSETEILNLKAEVVSLRDRWHDLRSETTRTLGSWYASIIDEINRRTQR